MTKNISTMNVYYLWGLEKLIVGQLAFKDRTLFFEYSPEFLKTGLELSPFKLPLKRGVFTSEDRLFDGLFGVFNDSLPDGWGWLLLERKLRNLRINLNELSPLDRLRYVGSRGMGALVYEPEMQNIAPSSHNNLDEIAEEVLSFQENDDDTFVDDLLAMNGSSAGARPKVLVSLTEGAASSINDRSKTASDWIIKFRLSLDPKDIGPIEYAYHLMAKAAGLNVPEAKLFKSAKGPGYFGVKRFDRIQGKRLHMHTLSGLLHADHRVPSLDYETIMKATAWLTKNSQECEAQFRLAVFNVLAHNRDDHAKNFSFLMEENGTWHVSPAYDLTFSSGPGGEHCTMVMGEGKGPNLSHFLKLADVGGLSKSKAIAIFEEVKSAVLKWQDFAQEAGVSKVSCSRINL